MNVQWVNLGRFRHVGDTYFVALGARPPKEVEDTLFRLPDVTVHGERWHAYIAPDLQRTSAFPIWVGSQGGRYVEMRGLFQEMKDAVLFWLHWDGGIELVRWVVEEGLR